VGHKLITDAEGKALGTISKKRVCDLNGKEIAAYERCAFIPIAEGKTQKTRLYTSELGDMRFTDGILFIDDKPVGQVPKRERSLTSIVMLSAATLMLLLTVIFVWLIDIPFSDAAVIKVTDVIGEWEKQQTVAVFDEQIAPGSSGEYVFVLKNPHNISILYDFKISEYYNGEAVDNFPIEYRVRMNNVLLETDEWLTANDLQYYEITMLPESTHRFTLEWRWSFNGGDDATDTYFGQTGGDYSIVFHMTAQTLPEE